MDSSDDEAMPLSKRAKIHNTTTTNNNNNNNNNKHIVDDDDSSDDDDTPLATKIKNNAPNKAKATTNQKPKPTAPPQPQRTSAKPTPKYADDSSSDDASSDDEQDDSSDEDEPLSQRKPVAKRPRSSPSKPKPTPKPKNGGSSAAKGDAPSYGENWYEEVDGTQWKRGGVKWKTLEHGGVIFPPLYEPHGKPLRYDGEPIELTPAQEEVATMFAAMRETDYAKNPIFRKNFMASWKPLLAKTEAGKRVRDLSKCDFSIIADHLEQLKEAKKAMTKEQKAAEKAKKDSLEAPCAYAKIDGRNEKVGNFRVEPPGLFRGRGQHPKMGQLKSRIWPRDITINTSKGAPVPPVPNFGDGKKHMWADVVHDNTVTWLAKWKDSINGEEKYVMLAANSSWKGISDMAKYEKARELKKHIEKIRTDYMRGIRGSDGATQQMATAVYLIDRLALRVGNEKNTDEEADTVGCCSLRVEHVFVNEELGPNRLRLKFLGKDSIEYDATTEVLPEVHKRISQFVKKKAATDQVFDLVEPGMLNDHFKKFMDGLSAKVFRTYNASSTLDSELSKTEERVTKAQRIKEGDVGALFAYYNTANKNVAELCNHQRATPASHGAAIEKMDEKIRTARAELKAAKKEAKQSKVDSLTKKLIKLEADKRAKEETKNVSLGTSKINYNDPRITVAWCKRHDVPITKPFAKTLLAKFTWAMNAPSDYAF